MSRSGADLLGNALVQVAEEGELAVLRRRARLGAAVLLVSNLSFVVLDMWIKPDALLGLWLSKLPGASSAVLLWWWAPRASSPRAMATAIAACLVINFSAAGPGTVMVGVPWHAIALAGPMALGVAAVVPWGARMQAWLVLGLLPASLWPFFTLGMGGGSSIFAIGSGVFALVTSLLFARQNELQRQATQQNLDAFREHLERLRLLTEHIRGVFWIMQPDGQVLYVSPRFEDVWKMDRHALVDDPRAWLRPVRAEDQARVESWLAARGVSGPDTCEYRIRAGNAGVRWIRDGIFPITGNEGELWRVARFSMDVTGEKESERASLMQDIARRTQAAVEEERKRMARDLHDDLGQALTGIRLLLSSGMQPVEAPPMSREHIQVCLRELDGAMVALRAMIAALRPPILDELGLFAALRNLARDLAGHTAIHCEVDLPEDDGELSEEETTTIFRIAQEALTNVARHSLAKTVFLKLAVGPTEIELVVEDDGVGIEGSRDHYGMRGMRERATLLNGTVEIRRRGGGGTSVHLRLPRIAADPEAGRDESAGVAARG